MYKHHTAFFTGHRDIPPALRPAIQARLEAELLRLIQQGIRFFGAGGARGFDAMAAQAVLQLRKAYPHIRLILVLPCRDQTKYWSAPDVEEYNNILTQADKVVYITEQYHNGCMQQRNRHMVDHSSTCICYMTKATGGTAYTVKYAQSKGLTVINIA